MAPWNLKSNLSIFRSIFPKITPSSYEYNKKKKEKKTKKMKNFDLRSIQKPLHLGQKRKSHRIND